MEKGWSRGRGGSGDLLPIRSGSWVAGGTETQPCAAPVWLAQELQPGSLSQHFRELPLEAAHPPPGPRWTPCLPAHLSLGPGCSQEPTVTPGRERPRTERLRSLPVSSLQDGRQSLIGLPLRRTTLTRGQVANKAGRWQVSGFQLQGLWSGNKRRFREMFKSVSFINSNLPSR